MLRKNCILLLLLLVGITTHSQDTLNLSSSVYDQPITSPMDSIQRYKTLAVTAHRSGDFNAFKAYAQIILRIAKANDLQE